MAIVRAHWETLNALHWQLDISFREDAARNRKCHDASAARGAAAIIPPRKNAKPWKPDTAGAIARNEALRASKRFGRTIWRRWSGYHRKIRVETKMHCVNRRSAKRNCWANA